MKNKSVIFALLITTASLQCNSWKEYLRSVGSGYTTFMYEYNLYSQFKKIYKPKASLSEQHPSWRASLALFVYSKRLPEALKTQSYEIIEMSSGNSAVYRITCNKGRVVAYKEGIWDQISESVLLMNNYKKEYDMCAQLNVISKYHKFSSPNRSIQPVRIP